MALAGDLADETDRVKYLQIRIFTALRAMRAVFCGLSFVSVGEQRTPLSESESH